MVGEKADGQILFGARSEKPKILFGARGEKRKNLFRAKWQWRKILFGSQRVKIRETSVINFQPLYAAAKCHRVQEIRRHRSNFGIVFKHMYIVSSSSAKSEIAGIL